MLITQSSEVIASSSRSCLSAFSSLYILHPMGQGKSCSLPQACFGASGLEADHFVMLKWSEIARSCPSLCNPMDCSLPGSSVHGLFQASVLECIAISFSRGSSQPRDRTQVSRIVGRRFTVWAPGGAPCHAERPAQQPVEWAVRSHRLCSETLC